MSDVEPTPRPLRKLSEREPVRVISAIGTLLMAVNAILLGAGVYEGGVAAAVTGIIAAVLAFANELFTRNEVVPLKPLEDLAAASGTGP